MHKDYDLEEEFVNCQKSYLEIEDSKVNSNDEKFQQQIKNTIESFKIVASLVNKSSIFSQNEELQDISTSRLKYILVPYYLAQLTLKIVDMENRLKNINIAKLYFSNFVSKSIQYGLVMKEDVETLESDAPLQPQRKREEKIKRAKREMELKKQLKEINDKLEELNKKFDEKKFDEFEEYYREQLLLQIGSFVTRTIDELILVAEEAPLLQHMEEMKKKGGKTMRDKEILDDRKLEKRENIHIDKTGKIFTIPTRKQKISEVFRPSYTQHTISIEEAGEIDYQEMLERQKREEISKKKREEEPDEDDLDYYDTVKIYKDREWDEWKDDNPTGSGNTYKRG
eukprot:TRINITY_DN4913_c0_g1_i1.p1 TRINITY_DN4913_c0_g1~~TRINITY_DN4913_c0_g1_i1.p1  ORF type:complete len:340 (+),score=124.76 TRINITY_DN4913_c0_g1_i1:35-1054(+)